MKGLITRLPPVGNSSKVASGAAAWTRAVSVSTPSRWNIAASKSRRFILSAHSSGRGRADR